MIDINWHLFKAKFNGREQEKFEQLSYMLFCAENEIKIGIFRFKNQVGIETEPIEIEGVLTGFQAKYYETKIADNKDDIIDSLKKAKNKNTAIQKVFIYTNQEFSESSKPGIKKPKYLRDIENQATKLGLSIEWRQSSYFEKQLANPSNSYLADYFFGSDKNIVDFINNIALHADHLLHTIQCDVRYQGQSIKINREEVIKSIRKNTSQIILISGDGGSGKTALIKELFVTEKNPIYIFKATEFHQPSIKIFFSQFGNFGLIDFLEIHKEEKNKTVVIDSAEKLADIANQDPFIEMLSALLQNGWKVIFTTRNNYFDDLRFQMIEVYRLPFDSIQLELLSVDELQMLAEKNGFDIPKDLRMLNLIRNPFYLGEYLTNLDNEINISKFRDILWKRNIQHSSVRTNNIHIQRERCFLEIAKKRAESGNFFVSSEHLDNTALAQLIADEVIEYEPLQGGYFITHDIYEEWALERTIEGKYLQNEIPSVFFVSIGSTLPVRRAFRAWLSEKLATSKDEIVKFVNTTFASTEVSSFWKDELLVSVLLSDHADEFFELFDKDLLVNDRYYFRKIIFLLRTACKEVDTFLQKILQLRKDNPIKAAYVFTKPKGRGWESAIKYTYRMISDLTKDDLELLIPFLSEWVNKNNHGTSTRYAGLIALHFYQISETTDTYYHPSIEEGLLKIILQATKELIPELSEINKTLIEGKQSRRQPYNSLREMVLTKNNESILFIMTFPEFVIKLADQSWYYPQEGRDPYYSGGIGLEKYYSLHSHWRASASALQTPVGILFHVKPKSTLDFIIDFTNKTVESYFKSGYDSSVEELEVDIDGAKFKQYISPGLWSMYRGNGSPVTPYLLQSLHMALEKYLLETAKKFEPVNAIKLLKYILVNTRSATITAVVTSVVLANYEKLFDIAIILFRNPQFMIMDNNRRVREDGVRSLYSIGLGLGGKDKEFTEERLATCDDPHRKLTLEYIALQYQYVRSEQIDDVEAERRKKLIQDAIDQLYATIPEGEESTEENKVLRLLLSRIDRRNMNPIFTEVEKGIQIELNPTLAADLKEMTEQNLKDVDDKYMFTEVKMWAINKFDQYKGADHYKKFDNDPTLVIQQTKELIAKLNDPNEDFHGMMNYDIPGYTCAALVKEFGDILSKDDLQFCSDIIQHYATAPLREHYGYQIADGTEVAISAIPFLYKYYPDEHDKFNMQLLFILLDPYSIGEYKRVCDYSIEAVRNSLFRLSQENANKIWNAYVGLKEKFDKYTKTNERRHHRSFAEAFQAFAEKDESDTNEEVDWPTVSSISGLGLTGADTVFQILPDDTTDPMHLTIIREILEKWLVVIFQDSNYEDRNEHDDYRLKMRMSKKLAKFLIHRDAATVDVWVKIITDSFVSTSEMANFISNLVSEEDDLNTYDTFWAIWNGLYPTIKAAALDPENYHLKEIIYNYLLAWPYWKDTAKSWRSLKPSDAQFFKKVCEEIGANPAVFYSITKFLNEVGSEYTDEGIFWIADLLSKNNEIYNENVSGNTIYYLEVMTRKYVYLNRTKIKTNKFLKDRLIIILNFLVSKSSVNGYLLREEIT